MPVLSRLSNFWRNLFHKDHLDTDLSEELRSYVELLTDEKVSGGLSHEKARKEALLELGGMEQVKEQVRDVRYGALFEGIVQDLRHALRGMKASLGSTALAIAMLALGIGATTLIFSVFYSVLLQPLPFEEPERLVQVWESRVEKGWNRATFLEANFWDVRAHNKTFEDMGAYTGASWNMTGDGEPERLDVGRVSANFFKTLGVQPVLGRIFLPEEGEPDHQNQIVLLQNKFWRTHFGADPHIIGKTLRLDGRPYLVVGVLPPGEPWLNVAAVFVPLVYSPNANRGSFEFSVVGRLKKGVSMQNANSDLQRVCNWLAEQYPIDKGMGVTMAPAAQWAANEKLQRTLWVLLGSVGFLLLIACVNLANLLIAKASARTRELTVRAALGASRGRIMRLVLAESFLLGLLGAGGGLLCANAGLILIKAAAPDGIPRIEEASLNGWVLGFTLLMAVGTGVLSGLIPALQAPFGNVASALREGDRSQAGSRVQLRLRNALVMVEVALSLMLLIGAGLLIRSFGQLLQVDRGFQSENRLVFSVNMPGSYKTDQVTQIMKRYLSSVNSLPQVSAASAVNVAPLTGGDPGMGIGAEGDTRSDANVPWASWRFVSSDYFRTMGISLLKGRGFTEQEEIGKPWRVVISQRLAELLWPGEDPIGRKAILWKGQGNDVAEVIGVVADMRERGLDSDPALLVYMPYYGAIWTPVDFVVHTAGNPGNIASALRSRLSEIDPNLPISDMQTLDDVVNKSLGPKWLNMGLLMLFAGIALLLSLTGIYGVLAYAVTKRTSEIGVRLALGANPRNILSLIVAQGMRPILLGIAVGLAGAFALSRFLTTMLFGIKPADPVTYIGVALLVTATALIACCIPAHRASRVDPALALRQE